MAKSPLSKMADQLRDMADEVDSFLENTNSDDIEEPAMKSRPASQEDTTEDSKGKSDSKDSYDAKSMMDDPQEEDSEVVDNASEDSSEGDGDMKRKKIKLAAAAIRRGLKGYK